MESRTQCKYSYSDSHERTEQRNDTYMSGERERERESNDERKEEREREGERKGVCVCWLSGVNIQYICTWYTMLSLLFSFANL